MANTRTARKQQSKPTACGPVRPIARLRPQNRKLLNWLDSWLATPDNRGEEWWKGFEDDLRNHRTTFTPTQTE
jgi:hypothetical protein